MKNKTILIALALMCLIGSISMASASQETKLNIQTPALLTPPSIYGNYVSWSDNAVNSCHLYDLTTGKEKDISSDETLCTARIYGKNAVFTQYDFLDDSNELVLYNIQTGKLTKLMPSSSDPSIYGNVIVYTNNSNVYTYDISTKKITQITTSGTTNSPKIYGNSIVYLDNSNIYVYNISTKQRSLIGVSNEQNRCSYDYFLDIYGNVVVWTNNGNIYMRNIATHTTTQITTNGISGNPAIYGNNIVWDTYTHSGNEYRCNIYLYSISTRKTTQVTKSNDACYPAIYGSKIVYIDGRNANEYSIDTTDLFVYDLTAKLSKPVNTFEGSVISGDYLKDGGGVTSGTHPLTVFFSYTENGDMATSYLWNFGDGVDSKHAWTATHTYTKAGTYTVSLKVTNSVGSNTATKSKYITVK